MDVYLPFSLSEEPDGERFLIAESPEPGLTVRVILNWTDELKESNFIHGIQLPSLFLGHVDRWCRRQDSNLHSLAGRGF